MINQIQTGIPNKEKSRNSAYEKGHYSSKTNSNREYVCKINIKLGMEENNLKNNHSQSSSLQKKVETPRVRIFRDSSTKRMSVQKLVLSNLSLNRDRSGSKPLN